MPAQPDLAALPPGVWVAISVLAAVQLTLAIVALVSLIRRPAAGVTGGNKWVWAALIVLINMIGPILYFALGRRAPTPVEQPPAEARRGGADEAERIASALYGERSAPGDQP